MTRPNSHLNFIKAIFPMSGDFEQAEGIILKVIPFRDYDQILTIFTHEQGIIKLIYKGSRSKRRGVQGLCVPLTLVQVIYREKRGELFSCQEMTGMEFYHSLRHSLPCLEAACDCLKALERSQLVCKPSPMLYQLLCFYLDRMETITDPWVLALSFRLKLLMHDGLARFPFLCATCFQPLQEVAYVHLTDWGCREHLSQGHYWNEHEVQQVYRLALCQSYQELINETISEELKAKVNHFFSDSLQK